MGLISRALSFTFNAALISTLAAGVRRSSGFVPDTTQIPEPTIRDLTEKYLGAGETIFDIIQATAVNSSFFRKDTRK